jgi:hypothetical protein
MSPATEINQVRPGLFVWQNYDPSVKADLFSTALESEAGLFLVDPIPLATEPFDELTDARELAGVIVTNANHHRDSIRQIYERWKAKCYGAQICVPSRLKEPCREKLCCTIRATAARWS